MIGNFIKKLFGVKARYDAAAHTPQNAKRWQGSDFLLSKDLLNRDTRRTLKSRARYECQNVAWLYGLILQVASDIVSTGPRLQMPGHPDLETLWDEWAAAVKLTDLLRTMCITKSRDGEAFCQITTRPGLGHPVKLFPLLIDSDRVQGNDAASEYDADGIRLDRFLEPVSYQVAKSLAVPDGFYTVMEPFMCHLFRKEMPEQFRGVSEIAPALPSIAMLRAYTIATLNKLEISSCVAGVLEPDVSVIDPDSIADPPFSPFDLPARSWITLPSGFKSKQFQTASPTDSQNSFALQVKGEVGRCLLAPKIIVLGDSSDANYSSGRLDLQSYDKGIGVERQRIQSAVLEKLFAAFIREAYPNQPAPEHFWFWESRGYINPLQEANAEKVRLETGTSTFQSICEERGKDWEVVMRQNYEREKYNRELAREFGFTLANPPVEPTAEPSPGDGEDNQ